VSDRHLVVALGETRVGSIRPERDGRASFRFDEEYRRMPARPVLGQWFEDDLGKVRVHRRRTLLPWFENLLPEGDLRRSVCKARGIDEGDDLGVLALLGQDLPGAVVVGPSTQAVTFEDEASAELEVEAEREVGGSAPALRFSLAGVQLKLSMSRRDDRWILPMSGIGGEWIAKISWTERFSGLAENEYSTMQWAKLAGFMVPECELTTMASLGGVPATLRAGRPESLSVFAIQRYDRVAGTRIHQEDLAQVLAVTPEQKYEHITYEKLGSLVGAILGEDGLEQWFARLALVIATGNGDAHLKNWSLLYPNRITPEWTPLYDQVCTIVYEVDDKLALTVLGTRDWAALDQGRLGRLAERAGLDVGRARDILSETISRLRASWPDAAAGLPFSESHRDALRQQWQRVPVLRDAGGLP
jgi:serine/threonine-protein kinase HipA